MKEESEKVGLKLNIQKMKIITCGPMANRWANRWGNSENSGRLYFLGLQNQMVIAAMKLKDTCSLKEKL